MLTYFASNLDFVKLCRILWLEFYWLNETMYKFRTIKCWFTLYLHMSVLYLASLSWISHSIDTCAVAIKNIRNMHTVSMHIFCILTVIYLRAHNVFETLWQVSFLARFAACGLKLGKKWGMGCSRNIMLSAIMCWGVKECCINNF